MFIEEAAAELLNLVGAMRSFITQSTPSDEWVKSLTDMMNGTDIDFFEEEIPLAIGQAREGLQRVTKIVQAMRDFSHINSEVIDNADLNKAIDSTVTVCRNSWKYVADLKLNLDPSLPTVRCSVSDINQVVMNLIVNAADAIREKVEGTNDQGTIVVATQKKGNSVIISVSDTGGGIPQNVQSKIFDPFFTTKEIGKGTGQGLSMAYSCIVEKHKGSLTFESEPAKGTTFFITLPLELTDTANENNLLDVLYVSLSASPCVPISFTHIPLGIP